MLHAIEVNNNAVKTLFRSCMYIIDSKPYCFIGFPFTLLLIQIYLVNYIQKLHPKRLFCIQFGDYDDYNCYYCRFLL